MFRSISKMPEFHELRDLWRPDAIFGVKIQIVVYVAAHCLFMREVMKHYPRFDSPDFFNAMSDETKRLLSTSGIRFSSPREAFPDDEQRRVIAGMFLGPDLVDSEDLVISPDQLFGMLLSFYVGHFLASFDHLNVRKLSLLSAPKTSEALMLFIVYATFGRVDNIPTDLHDACMNLTGRMLGSIKAILDSSPIR